MENIKDCECDHSNASQTVYVIIPEYKRKWKKLKTTKIYRP